VSGTTLDMLLHALKLPAFAAHYSEVARQAEKEGWALEVSLRHLTELELNERRQRKIQRLQRASELPDEKTLGTLKKERLPDKARRQLAALCDGGFVERAENVLVFGLPGRGKTHLVCALGHELVRSGRSVLFTPTYRLVQRMLVAKKELTLEDELRALDRFDAVILDDLGYVQQSREEMEVLFTFLAERYERRSVLITISQTYCRPSSDRFDIPLREDHWPRRIAELGALALRTRQRQGERRWGSRTRSVAIRSRKRSALAGVSCQRPFRTGWSARSERWSAGTSPARRQAMSGLVQWASALEQRPDKIDMRHHERLAVVYVRQSSMAQVSRNQESTKLQYSLTGMAQQLGWARERVLTIDNDLGFSGASAEGREGFQRLLAEVGLDHVGIILGVEMSRLARSNKDWHQLLELCARFGTLIADLDGLYDPSRYNDRLLLGLKGTMSEAELHILRQRLLQGKLQKARRGELGKPVPTGYLRRPSGEIVLDPDEEVRDVIEMIFDLYDRVGSINGLLRRLAEKKVQIGVRLRTGPDIGQLVWRRPHRGMLFNIVRNPIYAGTYAYGRRRADPRRQIPGRRGSGRTPLLPPEQWQACVPNRFPAYITWEKYLANQARLKASRVGGPGASTSRNGSALLGGLIVCGRCQHRMIVQYAKARNGASYGRYVCIHNKVSYGASTCGGLSAPPLDGIVSEHLLEALKPAALEVSLRVAREIERDRTRNDALWQKRIQRARYEAERAERQYQAVEPENRLVARTLERSWEEKMEAERALQEEHRRHLEKQPRHLSSVEQDTIRALANDLPRLWNAPSTEPADRKAVLRLLVERVTVTVDEDTEWVDLVVRWAGGHETRARFRRPVGKLSQLERHEALLKRIRELRRSGHSAGQIAEKLNADGWVTPTQRNTFNEKLIRAMLMRYGSVPKGPKAPPTDSPHQWWLADLAKELEMPVVTLHGWLTRGVLTAKKINGQWAASADQGELRRLRRLRQQHQHRGFH
jgi:DNA replication protein DnaC/DNA invertase Pin-like site-specific DNA recombinase